MKRFLPARLEHQFLGLSIVVGVLIFTILLGTGSAGSRGIFLGLFGLYGVFVAGVFFLIKSSSNPEASSEARDGASAEEHGRRRTDLRRSSEVIKPDSRFFSILSHEIRTPVTAISSSTQVLMQGVGKLSDERKQTHFNNIQTSIARIQDLIDGVTFVTQSEQGRLVFSPDLSNFRVFCENVIDQMEAFRKSSRIIFDYDEALGESLMIDENLLRHILNNILGNALKYSDEYSTVKLSVRKRGTHVDLIVSDQGIGIPVADQDKLFESFHRASNVADIPGTGLGLNIAKRAVEAHRGTISYETVENVGTTFTVCLPLNVTVED